MIVISLEQDKTEQNRVEQNVTKIQVHGNLKSAKGVYLEIHFILFRSVQHSIASMRRPGESNQIN